MKQVSTFFLKVVISLIGIAAFAFMLWEPHLEGRNTNSTLFQIYFNDPFLAYMYIASIPFYIGLHQAFKILGYIDKGQIFSLASVKAITTIKHCAVVLIGFIAAAEAYLFIAILGTDDIAGGAMIGFVIIFASVVIATAAAVCQKLLQSAVDLKSENDLTV